MVISFRTLTAIVCPAVVPTKYRYRHTQNAEGESSTVDYSVRKYEV